MIEVQEDKGQQQDHARIWNAKDEHRARSEHTCKVCILPVNKATGHTKP